MRVLFIGDIVGRPGREIVLALTPTLRNENVLDFVIANAENAAGGVGVTPEIADQLLKGGVDALTLGNHVWAKKEIYPYLDAEPRVLRPANYGPGVPGRGSAVFETHFGPLGILVLAGRVFMEASENPFRVADEEVAHLRERCNTVIVDMHAEATSEKQAMARHLAGRVAAVIGTHTHVQTADETVLPGGTAYITDVGMTGPEDSIIGVKPERVLQKFVTGLPARFEAAEGPAALHAVVLDLDEATGQARAIERIRRKA